MTMPLGVDICEPPMMLCIAGGRWTGARRAASVAGCAEIKNIDEIILLNQAAGMVDAVYHMIERS